jgi:hypothetical protein
MTAYGDRATLTLKPREGGGAKVRVVIPSKLAPVAHRTPAAAEA